MQSAKLAGIFLILSVRALAQFPPIVSLSPIEAALGSGDTTVTVSVSGTGVSQAAQVLWNGSPRATTFIDSRTLKAVITRADLAAPGLSYISVLDPAQNPPSPPVSFLTYLPLKNYDLAYDTSRARLYVSVSKQDPNGPSVAVVNPVNGVVDRFIPLPSEPNVMGLSDDDRYLYVSLATQVLRLDLTGASPTLTIDLTAVAASSVSGGLTVTTGLLPLPGQETSVVVLMSGVMAIFDNATPRALLFQASVMNGAVDCLIAAQSSTAIVVSEGGFGTTTPYLSTQQLASSGFVPLADPLPPQNAILEGNGCPVYANGLVYDGDGDIIDPSGPTILARFGASGLIAPVPELGVAYMIGGSTGASGAPSAMVFNLTTQQLMRSATLPPPAGELGFGRLVSWGSNGIAFSEAPQGYTPSEPPYSPFTRVHLIQLPVGN